MHRNFSGYVVCGMKKNVFLRIIHSNYLMFKKYIKIILPLLLIVGGFVGYKIYGWIYKPGVEVPGEAEEYELFIQPGWTYTQVGQKLIEDKIIRDPKAFDWVAKQMSYPDHVKQGRYVIEEGMSNREVIGKLRLGKQDPVKFTFNKFRTNKEIADYCATKFLFKSDELLQLLNDEAFLKEYGLTSQTAIAFFIPNTYDIYWDIPVKKFFERMKTEYNRFWTDKRNAKREKLGLSRLQVATVASIVEEETNKNDEKPRVAGVYLNRLKKNWKLEADPTAKYATGDFTLNRILKVHTELDNPYNTYKYEGLPPGPICTPSSSSLDAVLNAEDHEYMFFCAKSDFSGYHSFAVTLAEHNQNADEYHKALTEYLKKKKEQGK